MKKIIIIFIILFLAGCSGKGFTINKYNYGKKINNKKYTVEIYDGK